MSADVFREICIPLPPLAVAQAAARERHAARVSPNELRVKRNLFFGMLLESLEPASGSLYRAPSEAVEIALIGELAAAFGYDLRHIPGVFYSTAREFWKLNTTPDTFLDPYFDGRRSIAGLYVRSHPLDKYARLLTSKGLCLGTEAVRPL